MRKVLSLQVLLFTILCLISLSATAASPPRHWADARPITPQSIAMSTGAMALATAMDIQATDLVTATIGSSDPLGTGVGDSSLSFFPQHGNTFAILATGKAASADDPDTNNNEVLKGGGPFDDVSYKLEGLNNSDGKDLTQLTLVLTPPARATALSFDFAFYSEEFPDFLDDDYNDAFIAELGAEPFTSNLVISDTNIIAPANIALDPNGKVISVNAAFGFDPQQPNPDTKTTYDGTSGLLRATGCLPQNLPTDHVVLVLSITDLGDSILDSAVFLDNFQWSSSPACSSGVKQAAIKLTPGTAAGPINREHKVTAAVSDDQGHAVPNQAVSFLVNGAHSFNGHSLTNNDGETTFTYTGVNEGQDTITAWIDENGNGGLPEPSEPADVATKLWEKSTAVTLLNFTATARSNQVLLMWETASEINNQGFNLWRSTNPRGSFVQINPMLLPTEGNETTGHRYSYVDKNLTAAITYYYKLEDIDRNSKRTFHELVSATPAKSAMWQLYLPLISKD